MPNDFIPAMSFVQYQSCVLGPFIKVTTASFNLNVANFNYGTNHLEANNQAVLGVWFFASIGSTSIYLGHCDLHSGHQRAKHLLEYMYMYICSLAQDKTR